MQFEIESKRKEAETDFCDVDTVWDDTLSMATSMRTNDKVQGRKEDEMDRVHPLGRSTSEADIHRIR